MLYEKHIIDKLTVAVPTYNRPVYLGKLLKSLPKTIKIVVSDNGRYLSQDFKLRFDNVEFLIQDPFIEVIPNWNKCIKAVKTEWFILPSDDDLYFEKSFDFISEYIEKYPKADLIIFGHVVIDKDDKESSRWAPSRFNEYNAPQSFDVFKYGVDSRFPSMIFKTDKVKELGYLDESFKLTAADSKLIQMIMLSGNVVFVPEIVGAYRTWPQNSTTLTLGSKDWLKEIDKWQNDIEAFIVKNIKGFSIESFHNIKDEVYANNLLAGILNLKAKFGYKEAFKFAKSVRFPRKARIITKIKIIKALLLLK